MPTNDVILSRYCQVKNQVDGISKPLKVEFLRPCVSGDDTLLASVRLSCEYFEEVIDRTTGGDEVQAMSAMMSIALAVMKSKKDKGYTIYWYEPGDLDYFDFWGYTPEPTEFALPSVINRWRSEQFNNPERFLTPSCRVAVDDEGLSIVVYRVLTDGSDRLQGHISRRRSLELGADETAKLLGRLILGETAAGRRILDAE